MKLSKDSHRKLEEFFRFYYQDENFKLPEIHFYCGKFTKVFINLIKVHGITFGRRIYIWPELIFVDEEKRHRISKKLASHEVTHVLQYKKHGFPGFFYNYLKNYWGNLRNKKKWDLDSRHEAYCEIPFEVEARDAADKFCEWIKKREGAENGFGGQNEENSQYL